MSKALELKFRQSLIKELQGLWLPTIHVENRLNPGVPDMSYVIPDHKHETGWLELKAVAEPGEIHLEPSQVTWIERHGLYLPVHILIAIRGIAYFVNWKWAGVMNGPGKHEALLDSPKFFTREIRHKLPPLLAAATQR